MDSNCYLVRPSRSKTLVIDVGLGSVGQRWGQPPSQAVGLAHILDTAEDVTILLTHAHLDHTGGMVDLSPDRRAGVEVLAHEDEAPHLERPDLLYLDPLFRTEVPAIRVDRTLKEGDEMVMGDLTFQVLHTPGHTQGSICLYEPSEKWLFSGDTVFPQGSFGRVDFPGADPIAMTESLERLQELDVDALFPGHLEPIIHDAQSSLRLSYKNAHYLL